MCSEDAAGARAPGAPAAARPAAGCGRGSSRRPGSPPRLLPLLALLVPLLAIGLAGCGKKGPPAPPLRYVPEAGQDLRVIQRGRQLLFTATHPSRTTAGLALPGLERLELWVVERPAPGAGDGAEPAEQGGVLEAADDAGGAGPGSVAAGAEAETEEAAGDETPAGVGEPGSDEGVDEGAEERAEEGAADEPAVDAEAPAEPPGVPASPPRPEPLTPQEFTPAAKLVLTLEREDLPGATFGDRLLFSLPLPDPLEPPTARWYAVRTFTSERDVSAFSNQATIVPREPPEAPRGLELVPGEEGIEVVWDPGEGTDLLGYNVYRRPAASRVFGAPLGAADLRAGSFTDASPIYGESYVYAVTAIAAVSPLVESAPVEVREIVYTDRFAPPPPEGLALLPVDEGVRLVWRASRAGDVAGYHVYRLEAPGDEWRRMTPDPLARPDWTDPSPVEGAAYRVTAVDEAGNESAPSEVRDER